MRRKSIIQKECDNCYICGKAATEKHHVFGGYNRKFSEKYNVVVYLCAECHRTGSHAAHRNKNTALYLHQLGQTAFETIYGHDKFMKVFTKNYL